MEPVGHAPIEHVDSLSRLLGALPREQLPEDPAVRAMVRAAVFPEATTPARIGRFVIVRMLGAGGMGVVYLAKDEALDRLVAVKLLAASSSDDPVVHARLEREAKIMARLNHPNVVGVYEFGEHEGRFYVAMEYVAGRTLKRWLTDEAPSWRATLELFMQAGRGLIAAHGRDVIHRDFKPSNVLVGDDGRVRVADFGLAHGGVTEPISPSTEPGFTRDDRFTVEARTLTGQRLGTLAYMSPEQFRGQSVDARSDQFSFCVALWEALHDSRPYPAESVTELERMFDSGVFAPRSSSRRVPRWIDEVLARGLAIDRSSRWPSMEALVDQLSGVPLRRRRRLGVAALALAFVGVGVGGYTLASTDATTPDSCVADDQLAGVWDQTRKLEIERAIASSTVSFAADIWPRAEPAVDAYAAEWLASYRDRCSAHARAEDSETLHDQAMRCLAESRAALEAAVTVLVDAEPDTLRNAVPLIAGLPSIARCNDDEILQSSFHAPDDPVLASQIQRQRERLAELSVYFDAGRLDYVRAELDALAPAVEASNAAPINEAFWHLRGRLAASEEDWEPAVQLHRRALNAALETGESERAMWLAVLVAQHSAKANWRDRRLFEVHADLARSFAAHGDDQLAVEVALEVALAQHQLRDGDSGEAFATLERGAQLARQLDEAHWQARFGLFLVLGHAAAEFGRLDVGEAATREVLAISERYLGPRHPSQLEALVLLAGMQSYLDPEAALITIDRADALASDLEGERSSTRAWLLKLRGVALDYTGDLEGSLATLREAAEAAKQANNVGRGFDIDNSIGVLLDRLGRHAEARDHLADLLARAERAGHDGFLVAGWRLSLADALLHLGDTATARAEYEASRSVLAATDPDGPMVVYAENGLGMVDLAEQRWTAARDRLEQALAQREVLHTTPDELAVTRFGLARALWHSGDRDRARALAELALEDYRKLGRGYVQAHAEVKAWLADPS